MFRTTVHLVEPFPVEQAAVLLLGVRVQAHCGFLMSRSAHVPCQVVGGNICPSTGIAMPVDLLMLLNSINSCTVACSDVFSNHRALQYSIQLHAHLAVTSKQLPLRR